MRSHTDLEMDDFYRMFMVPGMGHWYVIIYGHVFNSRSNKQLLFSAVSIEIMHIPSG